MAEQTIESQGLQRLVIAVGILTMVAGGATAYWMHSKSGEAAAGTSAATVKPVEAVTVPAPPVGVLHTDVYFDFKSTRLRADAVRVLQETATSMDLTNSWVVLVQGYADHQGPAEYNRVLAQRRAQSVKQFLVELGVPEPAIRVATIGQDGALCDDPGKECQQLNRRVHLEFRKLVADR
ncbi:MAG TPA: OmpA family protein [Methylomirabilota bacterium]|jgi:peptidoglycan-associated lipoprotein